MQLYAKHLNYAVYLFDTTEEGGGGCKDKFTQSSKSLLPLHSQVLCAFLHAFRDAELSGIILCYRQGWKNPTYLLEWVLPKKKPGSFFFCVGGFFETLDPGLYPPPPPHPAMEQIHIGDVKWVTKLCHICVLGSEHVKVNNVVVFKVKFSKSVLLFKQAFIWIHILLFCMILTI